MKQPLFLNSLAALLADWITELRPSRMALVEPHRHQSRTSSRSLRSVLATTFISGMFECVIHGHSRPSAPAALLGPDAGHLPLGAEHHRPPEELRQHPGLRVHARLRSSRPPVDGTIPPQGRRSGGAICAAHQKFQRAQKAGVLENVIYSYARSLGYEVSVGCIGMLECDFIMHLSEMGCACMQVAMAIMGDRATEAPEHCLLERIRDSWPKFVITRNATIQHRNGIAYENVTGPIVGGRSGWCRRAFKREQTTWKLLISTPVHSA